MCAKIKRVFLTAAIMVALVCSCVEATDYKIGDIYPNFEAIKIENNNYVPIYQLEFAVNQDVTSEEIPQKISEISEPNSNLYSPVKVNPKQYPSYPIIP